MPGTAEGTDAGASGTPAAAVEHAGCAGRELRKADGSLFCRILGLSPHQTRRAITLNQRESRADGRFPRGLPAAKACITSCSTDTADQAGKCSRGRLKQKMHDRQTYGEQKHNDPDPGKPSVDAPLSGDSTTAHPVDTLEIPYSCEHPRIRLVNRMVGVARPAFALLGATVYGLFMDSSFLWAPKIALALAAPFVIYGVMTQRNLHSSCR